MENWAGPWRAEVGLRSLVCCLCAAGVNNKFKLTGCHGKEEKGYQILVNKEQIDEEKQKGREEI